MESYFSTPNFRYVLNTEKYICNKFGLAEFLVKNIDESLIPKKSQVLDVGCGAGPIGIYLADQFDCSVKGVELNPQAYECCNKNILKYDLVDKFIVIHKDFSKFILDYDGLTEFDIIVANPPIDNHVDKEIVLKYQDSDFARLDDESFSYLTNSWHTEDGKDLTDYIFIYAKNHLSNNGSIIMVICLIDCDSIDYLVKKGIMYSFTVESIIEGTILPESIGAESVTNKPVKTFIIQFVRR